jgi:thiaminase
VARYRHIRAGIDELPFLVALENGSLERHRFTYYLKQDSAYLAKYAVALEAAAGLAHVAALADLTRDISGPTTLRFVRESFEIRAERALSRPGQRVR